MRRKNVVVEGQGWSVEVELDTHDMFSVLQEAYKRGGEKAAGT